MLSSLVSTVSIIKLSKVIAILALFGFIFLGQLFFVGKSKRFKAVENFSTYQNSRDTLPDPSKISQAFIKWNLTLLNEILNISPSVYWKQNLENDNKFTTILSYEQYFIKICIITSKVKFFNSQELTEGFESTETARSRDHARDCKVHHLGLGRNSIYYDLILVRDINEPLGRLTLTLNFHRLNRIPPTTLKLAEKCYFLQNCSFAPYANEKCGLSRSSYKNGSWMIDCASCRNETHPQSGNENLCDWENAIWYDPREAKQPVIFEDQKRCFDHEKLFIFLGDSTNRGIMFQIVKQLNGSLQEWDKIHNHKSFENIGAGRSKFEFFYYPPFWLGKLSLVSFHTLLDNLLEKLSLTSHSRITIVIGGVQWLLPAHLLSLDRFLKRNKFNNTLVVVKGYGMGFHVPGAGIKGFPTGHSMDRISKHVARNSILKSQAEKLGFGFVDTFRMTVGRWTDYYPGRCACHYHYVVSRNGEYLIKGPVNAAYTNLVMSQICRKIRLTIID